jgi:hypothetical protein
MNSRHRMGALPQGQDHRPTTAGVEWIGGSAQCPVCVKADMAGLFMNVFDTSSATPAPASKGTAAASNNRAT